MASGYLINIRQLVRQQPRPARQQPHQQVQVPVLQRLQRQQLVHQQQSNMARTGTHFKHLSGRREYGLNFPVGPKDGQEHVDNFNNLHCVYDATSAKWWCSAMTTSTSTSTTTTSTSTTTTSTSSSTTTSTSTSSSTSTTTTV